VYPSYAPYKHQVRIAPKIVNARKTTHDEIFDFSPTVADKLIAIVAKYVNGNCHILLP